MPPLMPPPPSLGPLSTRLIKVVPRRASSCSSFSQLQVDGQDDIGLGGSDCSETGGVEDVPPTTPLPPLQPPFPKTPPINEAGVNFPAHKSLVGDTGITGLHSDTSATCGPSEKAAGFEGQEFNGSPRNSSDLRLPLWAVCVQCNEGGADVDWYQHVWPLIAICMQCSNTEKGRSFIQRCKDEFGYVTK